VKKTVRRSNDRSVRRGQSSCPLSAALTGAYAATKKKKKDCQEAGHETAGPEEACERLGAAPPRRKWLVRGSQQPPAEVGCGEPPVPTIA